MTDVEIFEELGEMGTLVGLFIEMGRIDGNFDDEEIVQVVAAARKFTSQNLDPLVNKYFDLLGALGQARMYSYLFSGLSYFADTLDDDTKINVLAGLETIAKADGVISSTEKKLYDVAVKLLEVE
jgi:uncharacterized tellurite resistance protein B-like protein